MTWIEAEPDDFSEDERIRFVDCDIADVHEGLVTSIESEDGNIIIWMIDADDEQWECCPNCRPLHKWQEPVPVWVPATPDDFVVGDRIQFTDEDGYGREDGDRRPTIEGEVVWVANAVLHVQRDDGQLGGGRRGSWLTDASNSTNWHKWGSSTPTGPPRLRFCRCCGLATGEVSHVQTVPYCVQCKELPALWEYGHTEAREGRINLPDRPVRGGDTIALEARQRAMGAGRFAAPATPDETNPVVATETPLEFPTVFVDEPDDEPEDEHDDARHTCECGERCFELRGLTWYGANGEAEVQDTDTNDAEDNIVYFDYPYTPEPELETGGAYVVCVYCGARQHDCEWQFS